MTGLLRPAFFQFAQRLLLPLSLPFSLLLLLRHFLKLPQPLFFLLFQSCHFAVPLFRGQRARWCFSAGRGWRGRRFCGIDVRQFKVVFFHKYPRF
ncbi:hypothetical protein [Morganella morganii]|uniref:hypothetical protein n=1 Tax=Morganella morganii TaxID=582 RepID=UPI0030FE505E